MDDGETPAWSSLLLPDGFGARELAVSEPDPKHEAPTALADLFPLAAATEPREPRPAQPFWLAVVRGRRLAITEAWELLGKPARLRFEPWQDSPYLAALPCSNDADPADCPPVVISTDRVRVTLPEQAADFLALRDPDNLLITVVADTVVLAHPQTAFDAGRSA